MGLRLDLLAQLTADDLRMAAADSVCVVWRTDDPMAELIALPESLVREEK